MAGHPSAGELVAAVRMFLRGLPLNNRDMFHARVAQNVLAIVERELAGADDLARATDALTPYCRTRESEEPRFRSSNVMGPRLRRDDGEGGSDAVNVAANLSAAIRAGTLAVATPGLIDVLIVATVARLRVDNPRYSTLARLESPADVVPQR
jgi:hypothetical protein